MGIPDLPMPGDINHLALDKWAAVAQKQAVINASTGKSNPSNLHSRSQSYSRNIRTEVRSWGAVLRVTHPGALLLEYGGTVEPTTKKALAFQLYNPGDTTKPTGPWIVVRKVIVPARHIIGRAGDDATELLPRLVEEALFERYRNP